QGTIGPDLKGVGSRHTEGQLRLRIVDSRIFNADTIMPAYYRRDGLERVAPAFQGKTVLTAEQIEDVVAFLMTLRDCKRIRSCTAAVGAPRTRRRHAAPTRAAATTPPCDHAGAVESSNPRADGRAAVSESKTLPRQPAAGRKR